MDRHFLMLRVTVKDGERAFLMRDGRFEQVLEPGRHKLFDPLRGLVVELFQVVRAEFPADDDYAGIAHVPSTRPIGIEIVANRSVLRNADILIQDGVT